MPINSTRPEAPNAQATYLSPLITSEPAGKRPACVCAPCPASIWYDDDELRCFCSVMKIMAYEPDRKPIKRCDGRTLALARLETAQQSISNLMPPPC